MALLLYRAADRLLPCFECSRGFRTTFDALFPKQSTFGVSTPSSLARFSTGATQRTLYTRYLYGGQAELSAADMFSG